MLACLAAAPPLLAFTRPPLHLPPPPRAAPPRCVERGKFVRHAELSPGCAPLGVLCAGLDEAQLDLLAEAIDETFIDAEGGASAYVPIVPLEQSDFSPRVLLQDVLAQLTERDSTLPDRPAAVAVPLVLMSGFSTVQASAAVRAISRRGLRGGGAPAAARGTGFSGLVHSLMRFGAGPPEQREERRHEPRVAPMLAVVVPNALEKPLCVLIEELEGDHMENRRAES
ncbi:hypothetical protein AB1Y20_002766 [Prymnesium parvum]|uniref:Uncharacterized protein n=1 Tax=Prymnesium parvum TaxID=97485 RepID=A0AB34J8X0_PRYPA